MRSGRVWAIRRNERHAWLLGLWCVGDDMRGRDAVVVGLGPVVMWEATTALTATAESPTLTTREL
jgi:hypothetical protein